MRDASDAELHQDRDHLALFGHFSLTLGDVALTQFSYDKVKALLVYLLLHDQPVNRATLAELLWPDQGLSSGRTNLRHALHCLRQSLGGEADRVLSVSRQTIAFRLPECWRFDLHELQALLEGEATVDTLRAVLDCYGGDMVEELQLNACSEFQRWLVQVRNEWRQRVIRFAENVLEDQPSLPDALLEALVSRFSGYGPFHERLVRQLAEQGQLAAAHEQYNAYLQLLALTGQQPDPGFLQLARYWSDGQPDSHGVGPSGAFSRALTADSPPLREDEIEQRQLSVMAIRLTLEGDLSSRGETRACLSLQIELMRWLEQQCHHLGGFWLPGATGGLGLACFGTHGPAHQLAELVALYEHCRRVLPEASRRHWSGEGELPCIALAAGLNSGRVIYLPERHLVDPLGQVTQGALELMGAAEGSELVISQEASQHMPPALDLQPRLSSRLVASDGRIRLRALVLGSHQGAREALPPSLVGREAALRTLRDALARAGIGLRQSVLVRGPSGLGKSALLVGFRQLEQSREAAICWQPTTRLSVQEPYGVARQLLRWHLGGELEATRLTRLLDALEFPGDDEASRQLLEEALGVQETREVAVLTQSGEAVKLVVGLMHRLIDGLTHERPLVVMIDDLQWLDEPSFKVLAGLQARLPINCPFLLVASHHGREALPVRLHWDEQITLGRLDAIQSSRLLSQLARRYRIHLSPRLRGQIIERCDGVPLYLQEICRRVDMGRREGRGVQLDELPRGLLGLLASRIDQLDGDREVAHVAAVLGRSFRLDFLIECSGWEMPRLMSALEQMQRLEIIEPADDEAGGRAYQFTHQLLQEAAYLSCPRDVRVDIHRQVVSLIEEHFPVWISRHPGDFATHLRRSGQHARGARYFELAAREALKVSANRTALKMADFGLASLRHVDAPDEREISLHTVRGQAAFALEGHGSPTAHESFVKARELLARLGPESAEGADLEQAFLVKWGLWVGCSQRHAHADAFHLASRLANLAARLEDPRYRRLADYARASCEYWAGRVPQAYDHLEEIDPLNASMMIEWLPFSDHPQVAAACFQAWAMCLRGDYQRAEQQVESAIRLAERINHPGSLAMALMYAAALYRQLGHVHLAHMRAERAFELTGTADLHLWQMASRSVLGWQRALSGDGEGLALIETAREELSEMTGRDPYQRPDLWYVDACIALDRLDRAEDYLDQCLLIARERTTLFVPELSIQLARVRHRLGHSREKVRALAEQALNHARDDGNLHQQLGALELWLMLIDPRDEAARADFRALLSEVSLSDAPVLVRWRTLLDKRLPSTADA
ncbi:AAA family ATPase [Halomonas cerina]|uniref:DNA-binding SARP family transcriptional activator/tetratricopeptide (TPR) repeat protein n=1 Tax=Halomonas cerina TaxID=447424 RepID=A0A839V1D1_9GAMM|nr:AAA family ATPase [Halomonas cerina]MBB3189001.1 DNA-binding SARP family transcriptional activator/tetratricopeptide (TPR) repeat protein [Halomonas cerina]